MKDKPVRVTATVDVEIRISADGCWGSDCTASQIHEQAIESIRHKLAKCAEVLKGTDIRINKWADIKTVITEVK